MQPNQTEPMSSTQGTIVIVLLACLLGVAAIHTAVNSFSWFWNRGFLGQEPTLAVKLFVPEAINVGEEFNLVLRTENTHQEPLELHSIDIQVTLLEGFEVVSVSPAALETGDIEPTYRTWTFERSVRSVEPGDHLPVTFRLKALQQGQFSGDIDVCNANRDYETVVARIHVTDAETED